MENSRPLTKIRRRKLGILMYDSRLHARRSVEECAAAIGVLPDEYLSFENGNSAPSLPQIELLSIYLNVPLEHFWSRQALSSSSTGVDLKENERMLILRNRVIGASLRMARDEKKLSLSNLAERANVSEELLQRYERGDIAVPVPELEALAEALNTPLVNFYDQHGPIGKRRAQQSTTQVFLELPPELQTFITKPVNRPYLDIALKLSDMPVEKLRLLAESLLEITY